MADINIQRKGRSIWPWLIVLLVIVLAAAGVWWYLRGTPTSTEPAADIGAANQANPPAYDPTTAPPYPATPPDTAPPDTAR